jgi:hypothetical protein
LSPAKTDNGSVATMAAAINDWEIFMNSPGMPGR